MYLCKINKNTSIKLSRTPEENQKKPEGKPVPTVGATLLDSRDAVQGGKLLGPTVTAHHRFGTAPHGFSDLKSQLPSCS